MCKKEVTADLQAGKTKTPAKSQMYSVLLNRAENRAHLGYDGKIPNKIFP